MGEAMEDEIDSGNQAETHKLASALKQNSDPTEVVDMAQNIVANNLMTRAVAMFKATNGRSPNKKELKQNIETLAIEFAEKAISRADADYDPKNANDQKQARCDELDDRQFDGDSFDLKMHKTQSKKSKYGKSETYDIYFGDHLSKEAAAKNLKSAMASFKMRNKSEPNAFEIYGIEKFLTTKKETTLIQFKLSQQQNEKKKRVRQCIMYILMISVKRMRMQQ